MTIELKSYNIQNAELMIIVNFIRNHPEIFTRRRTGHEHLRRNLIEKNLGISKSNFYRKVKQLEDPVVVKRLTDEGYQISDIII